MGESLDVYGVVGHPVAHSWSPLIHGLFARATGQSMAYRLYDFAPEELEKGVREFFAAGGRGLNLTLPHKVAACALADELTSRGTDAGAVNTLTLQEHGRILGDNTDGTGLVRDLCDNLRIAIGGRRILLIGAGGAVRGVLAPLLALAPEEIVIANRTADRAQSLAADFADFGNIHGVGFPYISGGPFDLVINATSASLSGEIPPIPVAVIGAQSVCYDMAYGKAETPFLQWATEQGCARAVQGVGMLVEQAAEAFLIWRGVRPATGPVLAALYARMGVAAPTALSAS